MLAVRNGKVGAVTELVKGGARREAENAAGNTAYHLAAANGRLEVCKALVEAAPLSDLSLLRNKDGCLVADVAKADEIRALFKV